MNVEIMLTQLRIDAMRDSLKTIGRFDPKRARHRFIDSYSTSDTCTLNVKNQLIGFYVLKEFENYFLLDHLYIHPDFQGNGVGSFILNNIKKIARQHNLPVKIGALKKVARIYFT